MNKESAKKKVGFSSIVALILGIGFIAVGIYNIITLRLDAKEYKNTTDIRTVDALVLEAHPYKSKDSYGRIEIKSYALKISFKVDGKTYTTKGEIFPDDPAFHNNILPGETIPFEVYRTSNGMYKTLPQNNPVDFLLACLMIPLGAVFFLALAHDLRPPKKDTQKTGVNEKRK